MVGVNRADQVIGRLGVEDDEDRGVHVALGVLGLLRLGVSQGDAAYSGGFSGGNKCLIGMEDFLISC